MAILVTGAAGFIGSNVAQALMDRGEQVIGIDIVNDYYDVRLKRDRLKKLEARDAFAFFEVDISDKAAMDKIAADHADDITAIIHLAAQAGVRYSIENPFAYVQSNLVGQVVMLEIARHLPKLERFIYASSSSVYGSNEKQPFSVEDKTDTQVSLYGATKKSDELLSHSYAHLYGVPSVGLRFFTVYGPMGRPDMAYFLFTDAILAKRPIRVFNHGKLKRDFTYIDDIVSGVLGVLDLDGLSGHRVYNLGNNQPVQLLDFIRTIEDALGEKAELQMEDMQAGDVYATYADISESQKDFGFQPTTSIEEGIGKFIEWYRSYY